MEKVLTTTDFVLFLHRNTPTPSFGSVSRDSKLFKLVKPYAELMQQPLALGMFTPCVDGKPIEEPDCTKNDPPNTICVCDKHQQYGEAKEQVLFEGAKLVKQPLVHRIAINDFIVMSTHRGYSNTKWSKWGHNGIEDIEDLARQIDLTGNDNFWKGKIGLDKNTLTDE